MEGADFSSRTRTLITKLNGIGFEDAEEGVSEDVAEEAGMDFETVKCTAPGSRA